MLAAPDSELASDLCVIGCFQYTTEVAENSTSVIYIL